MSEDTQTTHNAKALQYARTALRGAAGVAALSPLPQIKSIFELAQGIVETVEQTNKVETVFANLAAQVCRTLRFIIDTLRDKDAQTAKKLAGDLKDLRDVIKTIYQLVKAQQARNYLGRIFSTRADAEQARYYSQQLKNALEFFSLRSTVQIRTGIQNLRSVIDDLREDVAALKIPPGLNPSTASLQIVKHTRRKSDIGHKTKDNGEANQKSPIDSKRKPVNTTPSSSSRPRIKRSKSMDDIKNLQNHADLKDTAKAKADPRKSPKEKPPESSKSKNKINGKPKADNKKDKAKSQGADWPNKYSKATETKSQPIKKPQVNADEGPVKSKAKLEDSARHKGVDKHNKGSKGGKGKKPQASKDDGDQIPSSSAKPSNKTKDTSNSGSSKPPDKSKTEKPKKSQTREDADNNPMATKLGRSQSDSPNEKLLRPNDHLKRANSTGNVDKGKKNRDVSTPNAGKASNDKL